MAKYREGKGHPGKRGKPAEETPVTEKVAQKKTRKRGR
jgi:hypothetical protein